MLSYGLKPSGLYRHRRGLGLHRVSYKEGDLHIRIANLAFHAKESPIRTWDEVLSPGLGVLRTAVLYPWAGLLDYEDTRLKTSSCVRMGLYYDNNCDKTRYHHRCGGLLLI